MKNTYSSSCKNESKTGSSMTLQSSAIYVPTGVPIEDWLTSLRQASPVSPIPMQENERDQKIAGTSGPIPSDALAKWNQATQSWRTFQESFLMDTPALLPGNFPKSGTVRNGILYPLPMPVRLTLERDGGVLLGRWMTPNTMDHLSPKSQEALAHEYTHRPNRSNPNNLRDQIAVTEGQRTWPTPVADDTGTRKKKYAQGGTPLSMKVQHWPTPTEDGNNSGVAFRLNPAWVSWLMGIPTGWESLEPISRETYSEWFEDMTNRIWWTTERDLPRVTEENNNRIKRLRSLGNGIVPASLALFLRDIMDPNLL